MNTSDSSTYPRLTRHENIVKGFSQFAASLPADHELKWLMALMADNLSVSFSAMKDYFLSDEDI